MNNIERVKRYAGLSVALFICALGVALITNAQIGTSSITSLPYVLTFMTPLSLGISTFLMNGIFLGVQKILLKKQFGVTHMMQLPMVFIFGMFIDFWMGVTTQCMSEEYYRQLAMCIIGSIILGIGISLEIVCDATLLPGEGIVIAIAYKTKKEFVNIKTIFDVSLVVISVILSFLVLDKIIGIREGTIISALLVAQSVKINSRWARRLKPVFLTAQQRKDASIRQDINKKIH